MPIGYKAEKDLEAVNYRLESKYDFNLIYLLIVIYFLLSAITLESIRQPLYIISTVCFCFVGLFLSFYAGGFPFDQGGFAAFILIASLTLSAVLFLINEINYLYKITGKWNDSIIAVCKRRSRVLFASTLVTSCSLIPFLFSGENQIFWFAFAVGSIGGLLFSLFVMLVILPALMWKKQPKLEAIIHIQHD
jgi:multidrug efflux pump subunit AcrB